MPIAPFPCCDLSVTSLSVASVSHPRGSYARSRAIASLIHAHAKCTKSHDLFSTPHALALRSGGPVGRQSTMDQDGAGAQFRLHGALPLRHTPRLPSLISQSRHLPSLADLSFPRNPPPIPSTRVLVPMCRSSRYDGSPAPPTSTGGRNTGVVGQRGCLLCVIPRAAGCVARTGLRFGPMEGRVARSRVRRC